MQVDQVFVSDLEELHYFWNLQRIAHSENTYNSGNDFHLQINVDFQPPDNDKLKLWQNVLNCGMPSSRRSSCMQVVCKYR